VLSLGQLAANFLINPPTSTTRSNISASANSKKAPSATGGSFSVER
jgi:hypothetical protein